MTKSTVRCSWDRRNPSMTKLYLAAVIFTARAGFSMVTSSIGGISNPNKSRGQRCFACSIIFETICNLLAYLSIETVHRISHKPLVTRTTSVSEQQHLSSWSWKRSCIMPSRFCAVGCHRNETSVPRPTVTFLSLCRSWAVNSTAPPQHFNKCFHKVPSY